MFGEHSVVYGYPAVVFGIGVGATTSVKTLASNPSRFQFQGVENDFSVSLDEDSSIGLAFRNLFSVLEIDFPLALDIDLSIPTGSGLGSSAAIGVSVARALRTHLSIDESKIHPAVEAFEKVFHSSPSGVDQAAAMNGGIFVYNKADGIENILNPRLNIIIANVGARAPTHEIVRDVALVKEKDEARFHENLSEMGTVATLGVSALASKNLIEVGRLMTENHRLLKTITVSSRALDDACVMAMKNGALGAKLTGAGRGGCMIALIQEGNTEVEAALKDAGYWTHACTIPETPEL